MNARQGRTCLEQDCTAGIDTSHILCKPHFRLFTEKKISKCPECDAYKPAAFPRCRKCNNLLKTGQGMPRRGTPPPGRGKPRERNERTATRQGAPRGGPTAARGGQR